MKKIVQLAVILSLSTFFTRCICAKQDQSDNDKIEKNISFFIKHINAENFANNIGDKIDPKKSFIIKHPSFFETTRRMLLKKQQEDYQENTFWNKFNWHNKKHVEKLREEVKKSLEAFFKNNDRPTKIKDVIKVQDYRMLAYLEIADMDNNTTPNYKFIDTLISASKSDTGSSSAIPISLPIVLPSFIVGGFIAKYSPLDWFKKSKESKTSPTKTEDEQVSSESDGQISSESDGQTSSESDEQISPKSEE